MKWGWFVDHVCESEGWTFNILHFFCSSGKWERFMSVRTQVSVFKITNRWSLVMNNFVCIIIDYTRLSFISEVMSTPGLLSFFVCHLGNDVCKDLKTDVSLRGQNHCQHRHLVVWFLACACVSLHFILLPLTLSLLQDWTHLEMRFSATRKFLNLISTQYPISPLEVAANATVMPRNVSTPLASTSNHDLSVAANITLLVRTWTFRREFLLAFWRYGFLTHVLTRILKFWLICRFA